MKNSLNFANTCLKVVDTRRSFFLTARCLLTAALARAIVVRPKLIFFSAMPTICHRLQNLRNHMEIGAEHSFVDTHEHFRDVGLQQIIQSGRTGSVLLKQEKRLLRRLDLNRR
jgi:hypothetical protein